MQPGLGQKGMVSMRMAFSGLQWDEMIIFEWILHKLDVMVKKWIQLFSVHNKEGFEGN